MKRILIAIGAATSLALGALAAGVSGGTFVSGTRFDSLTVGEVLDISADDSGTEFGERFWTTDAAEVDSIITNKVGAANDKYLAVNETANLYRWMNKINDETTNSVNATSSIYFSADVQFTASEEASMTTAISDEDKLLIWLRATEDDEATEETNEASTNLIITASARWPGGEKTDFVVSNFPVIPNEWYRLVVKAEYHDETGIKFTVLMGTAGAAESTLTTITTDNNDVFYSMASDGNAIMDIAKVGFKGTGAVDDLEFGTVEIEADTFFAVNGTEYATLDAALVDAEVGDTVTLLKDYIAPDAGLTIGSTSEIVLDLAGHVISSEVAEYIIWNSGVLTVTNSTAAVGSIVASVGYAICNDGILSIVGGKFYGVVEEEIAYPIDNQADVENYTVYYISGDTATASELVPEAGETGYYVIEPAEAGTVATFPTAATGLVYNGNEQTGVPSGTGYRISGNTATAAGSYTATVTLADGYTWDDDVEDAERTIAWSIAKLEVTATVSLQVASAELADGKTSPLYYAGEVTPTFKIGEADCTLITEDDYTLTWAPAEVTGAGEYVVTLALAENSNFALAAASTTTATLTITTPVVTYAVTFSTNNVAVTEFGGNDYSAITVVSGETLTSEQIPAFEGGSWDVDPATAVITSATNFNYTISGGNWPTTWNNNVQPASMVASFNAWIARNSATAANAEAAFLLGCDVDDYQELTTASIGFDENGDVVITGSKALNTVNGAVKIKAATTLAGLETATPEAVTVDPETGKVTITKGEEPAKFYQIVVGYPAE